MFGKKVGRKVGEAVDDHFLDSHECLQCGHTF
jgi:hypothetical protein